MIVFSDCEVVAWNLVCDIVDIIDKYQERSTKVMERGSKRECMRMKRSGRVGKDQGSIFMREVESPKPAAK